MAEDSNSTNLHGQGLVNFTTTHYFTLNFPSFAICVPGYCGEFALWLSYGAQFAAILCQMTHILLYICTPVLHSQQSALVVLLQWTLILENPQLLYVLYAQFENNCILGWSILVYLPSLAAFLMQVIVFDVMNVLMRADDHPVTSLKKRGNACRCVGYGMYVLMGASVIPGLGIGIETLEMYVPIFTLTSSILRTLRAILMSVVLSYTVLTTTVMFLIVIYYLCCNQSRMRRYMAIRSAVILVRQNLLSVCLIICVIGTASNVALVLRPFYCDYDLTRFSRSLLGVALFLAFVCSPQTRHSLSGSCYRCCHSKSGAMLDDPLDADLNSKQPSEVAENAAANP